MHLLPALLAWFLGPRGCAWLVALVALPLLVYHRFGGQSGWWTFGAMVAAAIVLTGIRAGRDGLVTAVRALLAFCATLSGLLALIGFFAGGFDARALAAAAIAAVSYAAFRFAGRAAERPAVGTDGGKSVV